MKFELTLGIYRQTNTDPITFSDEVIHTESFELDFGAYPPWENEIPYKLLEAAKHKAESIVAERRWSDCEWYDEDRNLLTPHWYDDPHWSDPSITEVYRYSHEGMDNCFYLKLSWDMKTLERTGY